MAKVEHTDLLLKSGNKVHVAMAPEEFRKVLQSPRENFVEMPGPSPKPVWVRISEVVAFEGRPSRAVQNLAPPR